MSFITNQHRVVVDLFIKLCLPCS